MTGGGDKGKEASADEAGFVAQETAHLVLLATGAESTQLTPKVGDVILDIDTTATIASAARVSDYVAQLTPTERSTIRSNEHYPLQRGGRRLHARRRAQAARVRAGDPPHGARRAMLPCADMGGGQALPDAAQPEDDGVPRRRP